MQHYMLKWNFIGHNFRGGNIYVKTKELGLAKCSNPTSQWLNILRVGLEEWRGLPHAIIQGPRPLSFYGPWSGGREDRKFLFFQVKFQRYMNYLSPYSIDWNWLKQPHLTAGEAMKSHVAGCSGQSGEEIENGLMSTQHHHILVLNKGDFFL